MAMLASKDFTAVKMLPPMRLNLMIMGSRVCNAYPSELTWHVLVRGSLNWPFSFIISLFGFR